MAKSEKRKIPEPDFHPGSTLAWRMECEGMELAEVARGSGIPGETLQALLDFKIGMTEDMAEGIAKAFAESVWYWRGCQSSYERHVAEVAARNAAAPEVPLLDRFHDQAAERQGWITLSDDRSARVLELREHLGRSQLRDADPQLDERFVVIGDRNGATPEALSMWLRQGQVDVDAMALAHFDPAEFFLYISGQIDFSRKHGLLKRAPFAALPALTDICVRHGVGLVILENLPDTGATGAVRWRDDGKPWIQMTFAHQWMDEFWFDFYRLAAHIIRHPRRNVIRLASRSVHDASSNGADDRSPIAESQTSAEPTLVDDVVRIGEPEDDHHDASNGYYGNGANGNRIDAAHRRAQAQQLAQDAEDFANALLTTPIHRHWKHFANRENIAADYIAEEAYDYSMNPGLLVARLIKEGVIAADDPGIAQLRTRVQLRERDGLRALDV